MGQTSASGSKHFLLLLVQLAAVSVPHIGTRPPQVLDVLPRPLAEALLQHCQHERGQTDNVGGVRGEAVNAPYLQRVLNVIVILRQMRVEVHLAVAVTASSPTCCYFGGGGAGSGACLAPSYAGEQAQRSGA